MLETGAASRFKTDFQNVIETSKILVLGVEGTIMALLCKRIKLVYVKG